MFSVKFLFCLIALANIGQQIKAQGNDDLYLNDQNDLYPNGQNQPPPSFIGNIFRTRGNINHRLGDVADNVIGNGRKFIRERVDNLWNMFDRYGNRNPYNGRPNNYGPRNPMPAPPQMNDNDIQNINLGSLGIPMNKKNDLKVIMKFTDENGKVESIDLTSIFARNARNLPMPGSDSDLALLPKANDMTTPEPLSMAEDTNTKQPEEKQATNEIQ